MAHGLTKREAVELLEPCRAAFLAGARAMQEAHARVEVTLGTNDVLVV